MEKSFIGNYVEIDEKTNAIIGEKKIIKNGSNTVFKNQDDIIKEYEKLQLTHPSQIEIISTVAILIAKPKKIITYDYSAITKKSSNENLFDDASSDINENVEEGIDAMLENVRGEKDGYN